MPSKPTSSQRRREQKRGRNDPKLVRLVRSGAEASPEPCVGGSGEIPLPWFKMALAVPLLPVCWVFTVAFFQVFLQGHAGSPVYESPELGLFVTGATLWVAAFFLLPRPTGLYVLGHEWTHAIAALLCGARVGRVQATARGGYVLTDKNNVIISLSPYIVPFWLLVSLGLLGTSRLIIDVPHFNPILFFTAGLGWAFHISFTIMMSRRGQSDLEINGYFFSLVVIYLGNLLLIAGFLAWISPEAGFRDLGEATWQETARLLDSIATLFRTSSSG